MATIVVVDDDTDIRELVTMKLCNVGHVVFAEADGEAGLEAALQQQPDLVLLDWMMPRLTGIEVCRRMRADPRTARIPILLLTARAQEADIEQGFAAGADGYIVKPFSVRELATHVEGLLAYTQQLKASRSWNLSRVLRPERGYLMWMSASRERSVSQATASSAGGVGRRRRNRSGLAW